MNQHEITQSVETPADLHRTSPFVTDGTTPIHLMGSIGDFELLEVIAEGGMGSSTKPGSAISIGSWP